MKNLKKSLLIVLLFAFLLIFLWFIGKDDKISHFDETLSNSKLLTYQSQIDLFYNKGIRVFNREVLQFDRGFIPAGNDVKYFFLKKKIVVLNSEYDQKSIETFDLFSSENNKTFGRFIGKVPDKIWLTVEITDPETPYPYYLPDQIIEVSFKTPKPELLFHDIGKYTAATINVLDEEIFNSKSNTISLLGAIVVTGKS